jgi:SAM-dependent methyltransferase
MSFDALAPHYRWLEFLLAGGKLQRCRTAFLHDISGARNILLLGEGNGRFLPVVGKRFPAARITCVDASSVMLDRARQQWMGRVAEGGRVSFIHADVLAWEPPAGEAYDLIVTNFFLDCFRPEQLQSITRLIGGATAEQADWLLADFQVAPGPVSGLRSQAILWLIYQFFRTVTRLPARQLTSPDAFLRAAGFTLRQRTQAEWGLLRSDWWQKMKPQPDGEQAGNLNTFLVPGGPAGALR